MPSPAIFTSAGLVPSSFGPFAAGLSLARSVQAPAPKKPTVTTATPAKTPRIAALLAPFARTNSITLSDAPAAEPFPWSAGVQLPRLPFRTAKVCANQEAESPSRSEIPLVPRSPCRCLASADPSVPPCVPSVLSLSFSEGLSPKPFQLQSLRAPKRVSSSPPVLRLPGLLLSVPLSSSPRPAANRPISRQAARTGKPRANRAPRNPLPLRSQWRQPQGSPHPRQNQQRTRRPPICTPQFRLQPRLRIHRSPARPHHPSQRRHSRYSSQRHHRQSQSRRHKRPRLSRRPRQIRPHPRPRPRRPPRIPRHHHRHPSPPRPPLLARPLLRPHRHRH